MRNGGVKSLEWGTGCIYTHTHTHTHIYIYIHIYVYIYIHIYEFVGTQMVLSWATRRVDGFLINR